LQKRALKDSGGDPFISINGFGETFLNQKVAVVKAQPDVGEKSMDPVVVAGVVVKTFT